jgi:hypothetical protein
VKTSAQKYSDQQLYLFPFDRNIVKPRAATVFVGDFFEELTANFVHGKRYRTDGTKDICLDVRNCESWYESKSIGKTGSTIIYKCRLMKDLQFVEETGETLRYVFWRHSCRACSIKTLIELRTALAASVRDVVIIDVLDLEKLVADKPTKMMNNSLQTKLGHKIGYAEYGVGWSFRYTEMLGLSDCVESIREISVYDQIVKRVPVYRREHCAGKL